MHRLVRGALFVLAVTATRSMPAHPQVSDPSRGPLRPGDRVLLKLLVDSVFVDSLRIDETGTVILPRIGALQLTDVPINGVADSVRRAYGRVVRVPSIEVTPLRRVTVLGEAQKTGTYFVEPGATLREAIAKAGGITDIGTVGHLTILRGTQRIVIEQWERRTDTESFIQSGDVLWIDREPWLKRNIFSVISGLGVLFSVVYTVTR